MHDTNDVLFDKSGDGVLLIRYKIVNTQSPQ